MRFYKKTNGEWVVGSFEGVPAGSCTRTINDTTGEVEIINRSTGMVYAKGVYSQYKDINGAAYASLAALRTAGEGFFTGAVDNTDLITAIETNKTDNMGIIAAVTAAPAHVETLHCLITRPANQTPYSAGDVIGDVSAALMPFLNAAGSSDVVAGSRGLQILDICIRTTDTGLAGKKVTVHLYKDSVVAIADNAPFVFDDANITKRRRAVDLLFGTGNKSKIAAVDWIQAGINPANKKIYPVVETDAFTPSANSTTLYIEMTVLMY